jgi:quercetin dioxygenase-like cupin family protein
LINNTLKKKGVVNKAALTEVQVISRNDIPAIHSVTQDGVTHHLGELRDFHWHDTLKQFLAKKRISISWVHLNPGERLLPHEHPMESMVIILKGQGKLTGQKNQPLKEGDVVITPPNCSHGFDGAGETGAYGLSIQFEEDGGLYTDPENPNVTFLEDEKS